MQKKNFKIKPFSVAILSTIGIIFLITIDQLIKYKIRQNSGFYICNQGISFGITIQPILFWLIFAIFLFLILFYLSYLIKNGSLSVFSLLSFSLVVGGAISNALDRLFFGCVLDYIAPIWKIFPIFNLADIFISLGGLLFFSIRLFKNSSKKGISC